MRAEVGTRVEFEGTPGILGTVRQFYNSEYYVAWDNGTSGWYRPYDLRIVQPF